MKIVHIFWGLTYGGIETMLVNICNEQAQTNNQIFLMIINNIIEEELEKKLSPKVHLIKINREVGSKGLIFIYRINHELTGICPDIIHLHSSSIYKFLLPKFRNRTCCTIHDVPSGHICKWKFPWLYLYMALEHNSGNVQCLHRIKWIFTISDIVKEQLRQNYGLESVIINNGILIQQFSKHVFEKHSSVFHIVQVSRLEHTKKGQDLLIRAIQVLYNRGFRDVKVDLIGDGSSREYLQTLIKDCALTNQVRLVGKKPQEYIYNHLCDYDLLVQPSRFEGFGLTVAEAMAANVPVIVTAGQGPAEVTCGNRYGWLFENGNVENLADAISYIFQHAKEAELKADVACNYVRSTYDVAITARKYLEVYSEMRDANNRKDSETVS